MGSDDSESGYLSGYRGSYRPKETNISARVDEDFILDRFNLTGLDTEVVNYGQALDLIKDELDDASLPDDLRRFVDVQARLLYGLIHARWIVTTNGLVKMVEKYKRGEFGRCPRVLCHAQFLLPVGLVDTPFEKSVKLYCGRCEDLYSPKSSRHGSIDGAYFGTTFPHLLYLVYPTLLPPKTGLLAEIPTSAPDVTGTTGPDDWISTANAAVRAESYRPRIYGFQLHETAKLQRWQEATRDRQVAKFEARWFNQPDKTEDC
ncbi:casein kinase II, regulatory subunit [Mycena olivaceomarginata]|nr:casein kinase II, regulatory subunit [Mycena olivaceomarginata]